MRGLLLSIFLLGALGSGARADDAVAPADREAIQRVITAQLDAFRRDDGDAALQFAAPALQERFGDGTRFLAIVRHAYAAVIRPKSYSFGALGDEDGQLTQKVELIDAEDRGALALYFMEREPDGTWRIAGCSLVESERLRT